MKKVGIACAIFWVMAIWLTILWWEYELPGLLAYLDMVAWVGGTGTGVALFVMAIKRIKVVGIACAIFWVIAILPIVKWGWAYMPDWFFFLDIVGWTGGIGSGIALISMAIKRRKNRG